MDGSAQQHSHQAHFDDLTAWAMPESRRDEIIAAKAEYFRPLGEIYEDDKQFETRMTAFVEHFVFDRVDAAVGRTPASAYVEWLRANGKSETADNVAGFTRTRFGLYEVRKLSAGGVRLRDVLSGEDFEVSERRAIAGLEKGDILEARLIPYGGVLCFSAAFCCHPRAALALIRKELRRRKKARSLDAAFIVECAQRSLRVDRYRNIAIDRIYDFQMAVP